MKKDKELGYFSLIDVVFKVFSRIISKLKEFKSTLWVFIKDSFFMIKKKEWDSSSGITVRPMSVSGKMDIVMEMEFGPISKDGAIMASGPKEKPKDMEYKYQKENSIMATFMNIRKMDGEDRNTAMVIAMKEVSRMAGQKVKEHIFGSMAQNMKDNSKEG